MKLLKTCTTKTGFTFIEIMVAMSIGFIILTFSIGNIVNAITRSSLKKVSFEIITTLLTLRNKAMNNTDGQAQGMHFTPHNYTVFKGSYDALNKDNEIIKIDNQFTFGGLDEISFAPLSASTASGTLVIKEQNGEVNTLHITHEGTISW